jgi:anti-sigma factor RsiW
MTNLLICRYCRANLDAFLDSTLAPRARRRVARHIDSCATCYDAYTRRRDLRRELQQGIPLVGRNHTPDFDRIWSAVRVEIPRLQARRTRYRYGFAVLMLLLALLVPFTMGNHELTRAVPVPPVPETEASTETPASADAPELLATVAVSSTAQDSAPPTLPEPDVRIAHGNDN